jgi:hypothetical protein
VVFLFLPDLLLTSATPSNAAYVLASVEAGNTLSSFKVLTQKTMKELREKCTIEEGAEVCAAAPATPKTTPGKKRKAQENADSPSAKKAGRSKKAVNIKEEESAVEEVEEKDVSE